ncbi:hypothetical protein BOTCAL_0084g00250 [Botryotinia calthae]|uniref:Fungal N-terminal domain-containing protein n=1 Tax=Botryotinia calthae TaxID=38488 RepID=A0A4Y8D7U7_9HELO|nr:hypothetical protein BOTCAL_0084g00250 [Botryotinia calthae]
MDPITILGAASSAVGIASFGIQLAQVLSKFISDVRSAAHALQAILESIKSVSATMKHINEFLEKEFRNMKKGNKASLFSSEAITDIQMTTDQRLKIFWRVEAWIIDRDDSQELEIKLMSRLDDFKNQLKTSKNKQVPVLNLNKSFAKVRRLSMRDRLQWPFSEPKLEQYNTQLHRLQAHLTLMLQVITVCALQRKPGIGYVEINSIHEIYEMIPQTAADSEIFGIKLDISGRREVGRSNSSRIADDDTKSRLSSRFTPSDFRSNNGEYAHRPRNRTPVRVPPESIYMGTTRRGRGPQTSTDSYEPLPTRTFVSKSPRATSRRRYSHNTDIFLDDSTIIGSTASSKAKTNAALKHIAHDKAKADKIPKADTSLEPRNFTSFVDDSLKPRSAGTGDGRNSEHIRNQETSSGGDREDTNRTSLPFPASHVHKSTSTEEETFDSTLNSNNHTNSNPPRQNSTKDDIEQIHLSMNDTNGIKTGSEVETNNDNTLARHIHITLSPAPAHHKLAAKELQPTNQLQGENVGSIPEKENDDFQAGILKSNAITRAEEQEFTISISTEISDLTPSDVRSSILGSSIKNGIRRIFQRDHFTTEDMEHMFSTGCFITAFLVKGKEYHQIPSPGHFRLRKAQLDAIISGGPGPTWWKDFCFLEADEITSIEEILKPRSGFRKTVVRLKQIRKIRFRMWSHPRKVLVAIIINEPSGQLDLLLETSQARFFDTLTSFESRVEEPIVTDSGISIQYLVYSIHPGPGEDWLWAHITPQSFAKAEIIRRIEELNKRGESVIIKKIALQRLQQEQIGIIINAKNESDLSISWELALLDVLYQDSLAINREKIVRAITVYLVSGAEPTKAPAENLDKAENFNIESKSIQNADEVRVARAEPSVMFAETESQILNRERKEEENSRTKQNKIYKTDNKSKPELPKPLFGDLNNNSEFTFGSSNINIGYKPDHQTPLFGSSNTNTELFSNPPTNPQIWQGYAGSQSPTQFAQSHNGPPVPYGYPYYPPQSAYPHVYPAPNLVGSPPVMSETAGHSSPYAYASTMSYTNPLNPKLNHDSHRQAREEMLPPSPVSPSPPRRYAETNRESRSPYPEYYDSRSYDPHSTDYEDGKDIVRQLLLKWTPAGEEQTDENILTGSRGLDDNSSHYSNGSKSWETADMDDLQLPFPVPISENNISRLADDFFRPEHSAHVSGIKQVRKKARLVVSEDVPPLAAGSERSMASHWSHVESEVDQKNRKRKGKQVVIESEPGPPPTSPVGDIVDDSWGWSPSKKGKKKKKGNAVFDWGSPETVIAEENKDVAVDADDDWVSSFWKSQKDKMKKASAVQDLNSNRKDHDNSAAGSGQEESGMGSSDQTNDAGKREGATDVLGAEGENAAPTTVDFQQTNISKIIPGIGEPFSSTNAPEQESIVDEISPMPLPGDLEAPSKSQNKSSENNPQTQTKKKVLLMAEPMYMEDANEGSGRPLLGTRRSATTTF